MGVGIVAVMVVPLGNASVRTCLKCYTLILVGSTGLSQFDSCFIVQVVYREPYLTV